MNILTRYRETLLQKLDEILRGGPPSSPVLDMCRYHVGLAEADGSPRSAGVGKMVRPALCLAMYEALATEGDPWETCVPAALAIELVHRTSLIFDDIQDNSPQRNHRPTVWTTWGVNQALNGGLALSCYARLALSGLAHGYVETHRLLEKAVIELCRGQYMDIEFQGRMPTLDEYLEMVRLKTGVLMGTACEVGAVVAGAESKREEAAILGQRMGVAFQLQDDCLDIWGRPEDLGKPQGDVGERKRSLPVVLAMEEHPDTVPQMLEDPQGAEKLLTLLRDSPSIEARATYQVRSAGSGALKSLDALVAGLDRPWVEAFREMVGFMITRAS